MRKITPNIIEVDKNSLKFWQLQYMRLNNLFCILSLFALNNILKAWQGTSLEKKLKEYYNQVIPEKLFTENSNFLFDQFTYRKYYGLLDRVLHFFVSSPKIVYTRDAIFLIKKINENTSEHDIEQIITVINKTAQNLRTSHNDYFINSRGFVIKSLVNSTKARIHKILIKNSCDQSTFLEGNSFFILHSQEIIHVFNEKDYYFVINRLLNPTEFHHYLLFRAWLCRQKSSTLNGILESSLLGQYLSDKKDDFPDNRYAESSIEFDVGLEYWELFFSSLYKNVGSLKTFELDYAYVLNRISRLKLDELILLNDTFKNHVNHVVQHADNLKSQINILLYFGFVFIENFHKDISQVSDHYRCALKSYCIERQLPACIALIIEPAKDKNNALGCAIKWWIFVNDTQHVD